jgi:thioredoxin reductase (NADPH)
VVLEAVATGGQAGMASRIENYLGFPAGLSGIELASRAMIQASKFGARISLSRKVVGLRRDAGTYVLTLADGEEVVSSTVILAMGARYRRLDVPGEAELERSTIYYAATEVEALECHGKDIAVVGGGNSAGQAALFLAERARRVVLLVRGNSLDEGMSRYLVDRIGQMSHIEVLTRTEICELRGQNAVEAIGVEHAGAGERRVLPIQALFIFIGADAPTGWLTDTIALDPEGFILTGPEVKAAQAWSGSARDPHLFETSLPGVFAVGDVGSSAIRRAASTVGKARWQCGFVISISLNSGARKRRLVPCVHRLTCAHPPNACRRSLVQYVNRGLVPRLPLPLPPVSHGTTSSSKPKTEPAPGVDSTVKSLPCAHTMRRDR